MSYVMIIGDKELLLSNLKIENVKEFSKQGQTKNCAINFINLYTY